jgi:HAE1 family hydrophobic/amphiphilic exporter-1
MTLTELAVKRPSLIVVLFAVLTFLGWVSYRQLGYELLPKLSQPVVNITTVYPGASPGEVENTITKKIEDAISGMENRVRIRSQSLEGVSLVMVEMQQSANMDLAMQDAQRRVNAVVASLPATAQPPVLGKFALDELPIIRLGVTSGQLAPVRLYQEVKAEILPALSKIPGVGQITLIGGEEREIRVNVDAGKLESYRLSLLQLTRALQQANLDFPTGRIKSGDEQVLVRLAGKFTSLAELRDLVVATGPDGSAVRLGHVAEVVDGRKDPKTINRINKVTSIGMLVQKASDANAVEVSRLVHAQLRKLEQQYAGQGVKFTVAQDTTRFTIEAATAVRHDLLMAIVLVAAVMLLFLHSVRNSLIVMLAVPTSLVTTFIAMYAFGFTLNLMTLLALSLVVGILVDDSIVVLENIYRHLEMGKDRRQAALDGRSEIGFTALSITLVDVVVFLPIVFVDGMVSGVLRQFSVVVVVATLMSLFVSFTVTPLLASRLSRLEKPRGDTFFGRAGSWFERQLGRLGEQYGQWLRWSLRHKLVVLSLAALLQVGAVLLITQGFIGSEFVAQGDQGEFFVKLELDEGQTLENLNQVALQAEDHLLSLPEVQTVFTNVGGSSDLLPGQSAENQAELSVKLVPVAQRAVSTGAFLLRVRAELSRIPGVKVTSAPTSIVGGADQAPIQIVLSGQTLDQVLGVAPQIAEITQQTPGTADVKVSVEEGNPEVRVHVDKTRMATLGLSLAEVGATLQTAFTGDARSVYREGAYEYDIRLMLDAFDRTNARDVQNISFVNQRAEQIRLGQFARIARDAGPTKLERRDRAPALTISSQVIGRPAGTVAQEIQERIAALHLPATVQVAFDGELSNQNDAFGSLGIALVASLLFVYLIMVALYDSYLYPFVVLFSIPLAIIGALLALALAMENLSIFAGLGLIMLIGLVAKNAILLVDFTNHLRREGYATQPALVQAGKARLRPILMTTLSMIIGMLPIALARGAGAEWKNGLGWVLVGGLSSSMLLTLLVVPVVYALMDGAKAWTYRVVRRRQPVGPLERAT